MDSVRLRMRSDVPVGSYLSGGLDSSLVTAAAARQTDIPFATFSVEFAQGEFDELPYARAAAQHIGTRHHEIRVSPGDAIGQLPKLVWLMDEPNGDSAILPTYLVSQLAVSKVKVVLSGLGADELFGGYSRYLLYLGRLEQLCRLPRPMLRLMRPLLASVRHDWGYRMDRMIDPPAPWIRFLELTHQFDASVLSTLVKHGNGEVGAYTRAIYEQYCGNDYVNRRMYVDAHTYLPDQILAVTDRMSMGVSLEARTPFLDYRLFQFGSGLPGEWKVSGRDWKIILKEALGDLVPAAILTRPKWGFAAPVRTWMGGNHLDRLVSMLRNSSLAANGLLDGHVLREFLEEPTAIKYCSDWIWAMAILELWFRIYCIGDGLTCPEMGLEDFSRNSCCGAERHGQLVGHS